MKKKISVCCFALYRLNVHRVSITAASNASFWNQGFFTLRDPYVTHCIF